MAFRQIHLNKSGSGMTAKTACGRNILRTPQSANWEDFKTYEADHVCAKCAASKQAELNKRNDAKAVPVAVEEKEEEFDLSGWIPEDPEVTKARDEVLLAAYRAKKNK